MIPAPIPANEEQRLAALRAYDILDTPPEEAFDRITELLALLLDTPVALVSFVDADRQWFKSRVGTADTETPRQLAFCGYTILSRRRIRRRGHASRPPVSRSSIGNRGARPAFLCRCTAHQP